MQIKVGIREVHTSYRVVNVPEGSTDREIILAALEADEIELEYAEQILNDDLSDLSPHIIMRNGEWVNASNDS